MTHAAGLSDIYSFAYGRTRETIVPRHQRQVLVSKMPDLVGAMNLTEYRLQHGARRTPNPAPAERDR